MKSRDFCYWLQGFFELAGPLAEQGTAISAAQAALIKSHLSMVFKHEIDPSMGDDKHQTELNATHKPQQIGGVDPVTGHTYRC